MNSKPIIIAHGEPNSVFLEIFFKSLISKKFKNPLILVCSQKLLKFQMKKLKFKMSIRILDRSSLNKVKLNTKAQIENSNGIKKMGKITFISPSAETTTRTF